MRVFRVTALTNEDFWHFETFASSTEEAIENIKLKLKTDFVSVLNVEELFL